jgi:hypothetical protein
MKLLDEKGRLFGKINIIDFLIVVFLLAVIPGFFSVYKILGKRPDRVPFKWVRVEAVAFVLPEFFELMKEGDTSHDLGDNPDGRLLNILEKDEGHYKKVIERLKGGREGEGVQYRVPAFLEFELLCSQEGKNKPLYYSNDHIWISLDREDGFDFRTNKYKLTCYALKIYN